MYEELMSKLLAGVITGLEMLMLCKMSRELINVSLDKDDLLDTHDYEIKSFIADYKSAWFDYEEEYADNFSME